MYTTVNSFWGTQRSKGYSTPPPPNHKVPPKLKIIVSNTCVCLYVHVCTYIHRRTAPLHSPPTLTLSTHTHTLHPLPHSLPSSPTWITRPGSEYWEETTMRRCSVSMAARTVSTSSTDRKRNGLFSLMSSRRSGWEGGKYREKRRLWRWWNRVSGLTSSLS